MILAEFTITLNCGELMFLGLMVFGAIIFVRFIQNPDKGRTYTDNRSQWEKDQDP